MFIPAFVGAIFLYSLYELRYIKKHFRYELHSVKNLSYVQVFIHKAKKYNFILAYKTRAGKIKFIEPEKESSEYVLGDKKERELFLYVFGSFDVFRHIFPISIRAGYETEKTKTFSQSEKYSSEDDLKKVDILKTSMSHVPYVKKDYTNIGGTYSKNDFALLSHSPLRIVSCKNLAALHLLMIAIGILGVFLEWQDIILNTLLISSVLITAFLHKLRGSIPEIYKNILLIVSFGIMLVLSYYTRDMSGPGSVFLLQILIFIYLFPKDFKNSFLYIFLLLFVFVAISLFSNQIWFILMFLLYLALSIYLLFYISGTESVHDKEYKLGNKISVKSFFKAYTSVFCLMFVLYFILPHGNASESRTYFGNDQNEGFVSGFNEEISLENTKNIREDRSKVIVVNDISLSEVSELGIEYFRGRRYNFFDGKKWNPRFRSDFQVFENRDTQDTTTLSIQYYLNGSRYLYLPAGPHSISGTDIRFGNIIDDNTTLRTYLGINEPIRLFLDFETDKSGKIVDAYPNSLEVSNNVDAKVEEVFREYLQSIPEEITKSPELLSDYVQNRSGFEYSTLDIAENISDFLYGKKQGHCEYYATTLMIALQYFGYSPTFVSGFGYGEYNSYADSYIIRASNAHTWVELYDENLEEWKILDPTPGQSISAQSSIAISFERLREVYDYLDITWYTYIVNYTGDEQKRFFLGLLRNAGNILLIFFGFFLFFKSITLFNFLYNFMKLSRREKMYVLLTLGSTKKDIFPESLGTKAEELKRYIYANTGQFSYYQIITYKYALWKKTRSK